MNVRVEKKDRITTIIIDRPEVRNAIDAATAKELTEAFRNFESDINSSVAVLWGAGGSFCAGADLKEIINSPKSFRIKKHGYGPLGPTRMLLKKPVLAAIAGYAVAGGFELALWCDLRIVEKSAILGFFNRRWGIPLIDGGTVRLPQMIGMSRALDLILTGRMVTSKEARDIGLANRIVDDGCARQETEKLALNLASYPQICLRHDRISAFEQAGLAMKEAILNEFRHGVKVLQSKEPFVGARRFVEGEGRHGSVEKQNPP